MSDFLKPIEELIDNLPINKEDANLQLVLKDFSKTVLTTFRGGQKNSSTREVAECILWLTNEYLHNHSSLLHLADEFIDFYDSDKKFIPATIHPNLVNVWKESATDFNDLYISRLKPNQTIKKLEDSGFFQHGVSRSQCYFIDGVLENYYSN